MAETEFKYDVFISYSHKDEEWVVNNLLPTLEKAGLSVCIDYRDFDAGKPSIVNMEEAVDESRHTVLVLTPNWMGSEWTDFEAVLTQTDDPVGKRQKMIPIMLNKCDPPKRVRALTYVDFMRSDRLDNAWTQLFKALGKPDAPIPMPGIPTPATGSRDTWHLAHPYPMPPNFTGRDAEQKMLDEWLANDKDRLFILRALGGFGKSALAWQWISTHVDPAKWTKLIFWSFYEGDASFEHFTEEILKYLNHAVPQSKREQVDELLKVMQAQKVLLVMDGFERALHAYSSMSAAYQADESPLPQGEGKGDGENTQLDCVDLNAELFLKSVCSLPNLKSRALITTRLTPRAVKPHGEFMLGCREEELTAMQKVDAVAFFHKQKINGTHTEIEAACEPYGYHPLSLRLLAGRIVKDFEHPGDIVVAQHLKINGNIIQQKHHVLEVSYKSLPAPEQKLLSTIACFRAPVELKTIESVVNDVGAEHAPPLRDQLHDLVDRGLLHFDDKNKKFDLHPIVRRFAYDRLTAANRTGAHERLVNYFQAVPKPQNIKTLEDLAPVIELYHHMLRAGNLDEACDLFYDRLEYTLYYQFGTYQLCVELLRALFLDGEDKPPHLKKESDQAWALNSLANSYALSGQPRRAVPLFEIVNAMVEKAGDKKNLTVGLGSVAQVQLVIGALSAAERNLRRRIELSREIADENKEGIGHYELGRVLVYIGQWDESEKALNAGEELKKKTDHLAGQSIIYSYSALRFLLMLRSDKLSATDYHQTIIECAVRSLELANEWARTQYPVPRDYVRGYWLLGAAYCANNDLTLAEENLSKALNLCRQINLVELEADILLDLARLRYTQGDFKEAQEKASEALMITERSGFVLQGADVNLFMAQLALTLDPSPKGRGEAREYAETALKLATCDGPPYYYKVAYEEAERLIEKLK